MYVLNKKQKIQEEEENLLHHQVHPGRCFGLEPESGDLELECNGERRVRIILILVRFECLCILIILKMCLRQSMTCETFSRNKLLTAC